MQTHARAPIFSGHGLFSMIIHFNLERERRKISKPRTTMKGGYLIIAVRLIILNAKLSVLQIEKAFAIIN